MIMLRLRNASANVWYSPCELWRGIGLHDSAGNSFPQNGVHLLQLCAPQPLTTCDSSAWAKAESRPPIDSTRRMSSLRAYREAGVVSQAQELQAGKRPQHGRREGAAEAVVVPMNLQGPYKTAC